jgi:hypothetical protein
MAGRKITQLPTLTTPEATDKLVIVDVSDTSESPQGTSKQIAVENLKPYKVYSALITQTGTDAPVATVLQNTLGVTMTWSRFSTGVYIVTAGSGIFLENKTWVVINNINLSSGTYYDINRDSNSIIAVGSAVYDAGSPPYVRADDLIGILSIEIRVYP